MIPELSPALRRFERATAEIHAAIAEMKRTIAAIRTAEESASEPQPKRPSKSTRDPVHYYCDQKIVAGYLNGLISQSIVPVQSWAYTRLTNILSTLSCHHDRIPADQREWIIRAHAIKLKSKAADPMSVLVDPEIVILHAAATGIDINASYSDVAYDAAYKLGKKTTNQAPDVAYAQHIDRVEIDDHVIRQARSSMDMAVWLAELKLGIDPTSDLFVYANSRIVSGELTPVGVIKNRRVRMVALLNKSRQVVMSWEGRSATALRAARTCLSTFQTGAQA